MGRLSGKTALITGGASGIGAASARRFAEEGADLALADLQPFGDELRASLGDARVSFHSIDVLDEESIRAAVTAAEAEHGKLDVLLNAAGVTGYGAAHELAVEEWDRVLNINLRGSYLVAKHVLPGMMQRRSGSIVHIASVEGMTALNQQLSYNASKGAVIMMTKNMAIDYGGEGIRVNCLCPGLIDTPMTAMLKEEGLVALREQMVELHAMKRAGKPEEIANCALFLASDEASFVTGSAMVVDGGWTAGHRLEVPL